MQAWGEVGKGVGHRPVAAPGGWLGAEGPVIGGRWEPLSRGCKARGNSGKRGLGCGAMGAVPLSAGKAGQQGTEDAPC